MLECVNFDNWASRNLGMPLQYVLVNVSFISVMIIRHTTLVQGVEY